MLHGHRVSRQELGADRNCPCGRDEAANLGYQLVSRQTGSAPGSAGREDIEELEESSLRKTEGTRGGKINPTEQAMARRFLNRNGVQTEQDQSVEDRGLPLTGGHLWQR